MSVEPETTTSPPSPRLGLRPMIIFGSRWLQLPLYLGLIVAQCVDIVVSAIAIVFVDKFSGATARKHAT